ncbi:MAG: electron transport complex subunit RsxB [Ramlibacter sp.]
MTPLAARLHAVLPQTQCTRCGYPDCEAYAAAMAGGSATHNQCPPGGAEGVRRLAAILGQPGLPLSPAHGLEGPRMLAVIDEAWCIGCTLCLDACPTDAILGLNKHMHTVIEPSCTGCQLCVPVCPVDCIALVDASGDRTGWNAWSQPQAQQALERYERRKLRLAQEAAHQSERLERKAQTKLVDMPAQTPGAQGTETDRKRATIEAALARAHAQRPPG